VALPGLTVPFTVAEVPATALTVPVIADGVAAAAPWTTMTPTSTAARVKPAERDRPIWLERIPLP
jgi:hypothetical protein